MMSDANDKIVHSEPEPFAGELPKSLGEYLITRLKQHGSKVAFIDGKSSEEITFDKLLDKSMKLAKCLKKAGYKKNDVIGIVSENRMEFPVVTLACHFIGAILAPMNVTYREHELKHAFTLSDIKILFISPYIVERVMNVLEDNPEFAITTVLLEENVFKNQFGLTLFEEFMNSFNVPQSEHIVPAPVDMDEHVSVILCSSGTTGLPKGVQQTQNNLLTVISSKRDTKIVAEIPKDEDICLLKVLPWFHTFGYSSMLIGISFGYKQVLLPKFEERSFLSCIQTYRVNVMFLVPPLMVFLAKHSLVDQYDLSSLKEFIVGAAPLRKEVQEAVKERIGIKSIVQGFGMSETTYAVLKQVADYCKPGSVGVLAYGTSCKVIDTETGAVLGPNELGELCFKGAVIMKGYINNGKETQEMIKDGWLHTGDIGYYDEDKEFFIVDRMKELIKYKGYQVAPAELEAILLTHPKINDAAVVGVPDEDAGELSMAFVVKKPNVDISEDEVIAFVAEQTSPAKRLHGGVRFIAEIPKNASGKIMRKDVKQLLNV